MLASPSFCRERACHRFIVGAYLCGGPGEGRMVDLKQTLSRFLSIPGVRQAILVGRDGLMIEGLTHDGKDDMEAVGAIRTTGLSTAEALGQEIARGGVVSVIMEYENA